MCGKQLEFVWQVDILVTAADPDGKENCNKLLRNCLVGGLSPCSSKNELKYRYSISRDVALVQVCKEKGILVRL